MFNPTTINYGNVVSGSSALPSGANTNYFYFRAVGYLIPPTTGVYTVGFNSSNGCNLIVGGQVIISNLKTTQTANSSLAYTQSMGINLTAGVWYQMAIEWQYGAGSAYECQFIWTLPKGTPALVPSTSLSTSSTTITGSLAADVWNGTSLMWYPTGAGVVNFGYTGSWSSTVGYVASDEVTYTGSYWKCLATNINSAPTLSNGNWQNVGSTLVGIAAYLGGSVYYVNNQVTYSGNVYTCIATTLGNLPTNATYWVLVGPANLDAVPDGTTYARVVSTALTSNQVDPSASGVLAKGSTPQSINTPFLYAANSSEVILSWYGQQIYRADGTTTSISDGNQAVTGLKAGTNYYFYPYMVEGSSAISWLGSSVVVPNITGVSMSGAGYITTTSSGTLGTNLAISAWFKTTGTNEIIVEHNSTQGFPPSVSTCYPSLYVNSTGGLTFQVSSGAAYSTASTGPFFNDGIWHNVVLNATGSGALAVYVDDVQVINFSTISNFGQQDTGESGNGGAVGVSYGYWSGTLAKVGIGTALLTASQINSIFTTQLNIGNAEEDTYALTLGFGQYWKLSETSGTSAADSTGDGNTGTYQGVFTLNQSSSALVPTGSPAIAWRSGFIQGAQNQSLQGQIPLSFGSILAATTTTGTGGGSSSGGGATGGQPSKQLLLWEYKSYHEAWSRFFC